MKFCCFITTILFLAFARFSNSLSTEEQQNLINHLNDFRSKFAASTQISNMYQLEYNKIRENEAKNYSKSCPFPDDLKDQPHYAVLDKKYVKNFLKYSQNHGKEINGTDKFFGAEDYFSYVLRPLYMEVGCAELPKPCKLEVKTGGIQNITVKTLCIFGPYMEPADLDRLYGKPGSGCVYGKAENGLCKKAIVLEATEE
ncbi:hypothetical protein CRE_29047 [Caenorhabditis remanei]|uniref:SCP domain-containing protein n=1 Tax=Caenorhabditis remanei TaxID=31234 RepID=E3NA70_CAERE|nr:hypothetical protein CRE_29047 [Caenorhabditis remanei]